MSCGEIKIGWTCAIEDHMHETKAEAQQCINQAWIGYMHALPPKNLRMEARTAWARDQHITASPEANHV